MSSSLYIPPHRPLLLGESLPLPPSKSIAARQLILQAIEGSSGVLDGYDWAELPEDLRNLSRALASSCDRSASTISVGESGTAMRLMLAYLCASPLAHPVRLEGTARQHHRPIAPLVEALRALGGQIDYLGTEGYPPLLISPSPLHARAIQLDASASSQYLSALMLIAPRLTEGGEYKIELLGGRLASAPYVEITRACMQEAGYHWQQNRKIFSYISREETSPTSLVTSAVESDWTAASYAYLLSVLSMDTEASAGGGSVLLPGLRLPSIQGDSVALVEVASQLGIETKAHAGGIQLVVASRSSSLDRIELDCYDTPDLVPTLVAMFLARQVPFVLRRVAHLRLKESDRLLALAQECTKLGFSLEIGDDTLTWTGRRHDYDKRAPIGLETYRDHRIAMALAPLMAAIHPRGVWVMSPEVVGKSYPGYWAMLSKVGYKIETTKM